MSSEALSAGSALPVAFGAAASVATFLGGLLALRLGKRINLVMALTAGVVLGVALFDLLPEALKIGAGLYQTRTLCAALGLGFVTYMIADRVLSARSTTNVLRPHLGPASLTVHSFLDGMGIGLAFQVSIATGGVIALAVLAHDLSDGVNTVGLALAGSRREDARRWLTANAAAPLVGVIVGQIVQVPASVLALLLAAFAGMFFYIGACELLPRSYLSNPTATTTAATLAGMAIMFCVVTLAGG